MQNRFSESMQKFGFPNSGNPILVGVSGGVDSMVLASMLLENGYAIAVAHCNYQLRGEASDADETLVKNWCAQRNVPFHSKRIETQKLAEESKASIQMVAREERYRFFQKLTDEYGYAATALAHHANDRVESLILNVLRGTGFRGLQGMPSKRVGYIRPLLGLTKDEIRDYAKEKGVPFREDASNAQTYYQRNWVRLRLLPMLAAKDETAFSKLLQLCERAENQLPNYERWVQMNLSELESDNGISIHKLKESNAPFTLLKELLEPNGFSSDQVFEVLDILNSMSGSEVCSDTHRVLKDRETLIISELNTHENPPKLQFEVLDRSEVKSLNTEPNVALIDAATIKQENFKLRHWQQGDRFKPLGMKGWKLLSDFFIDEKLSVTEKGNVWLLTHRNEIVWVVGMRLDDRFKVTDSTQKILRVHISDT
ncbi:MAG: tRNA lysidine(34) synthetase TilS [Flavobacteriales bacterium]|nr:tRNA lysidine(34) synthetase TilS [Flavobacteriales bacterium]